MKYKSLAFVIGVALASHAWAGGNQVAGCSTGSGQVTSSSAATSSVSVGATVYGAGSARVSQANTVLVGNTSTAALGHNVTPTVVAVDTQAGSASWGSAQADGSYNVVGAAGVTFSNTNYGISGGSSQAVNQASVPNTVPVNQYLNHQDR